MDNASRYRETLEAAAAQRAQHHPTKAAIAEAEEYLQLLYSIDYIFRRHSLDIDVETAERYVDLLYRIKNLSAFIPDEDDVARLEHHVAQLERAADR
jgi:hypothetical protein